MQEETQEKRYSELRYPVQSSFDLEPRFDWPHQSWPNKPGKHGNNRNTAAQATNIAIARHN
jgi:hypothetical protein